MNMIEKTLQRKEEKVTQLERKNGRLKEKVNSFMENMKILREQFV